jgi:hypothetical protein
MRQSRVVLVGLALLIFASACASNRYVHKNGGAPLHEVRFVNTCSRFTGRLYIDDEYRNKHKIDVKSRAIGSRPYTMRLAAGSHRFYVEFREFESIKFKEGTFLVRGPSIFEMC